VAAQSQAYIGGRSFSGTVGSNPAGSMDMSLLSVACCQVLVSASGL
jgi:hypothetical protein